MLRRLFLLAILAGIVVISARNAPTSAGPALPPPDRVVDTFFPECIGGHPTYTSIKDAVTASSPGDVIYVCPGPSYYEPTIDIATSSIKIFGPAINGIGGTATLQVSSLTTGDSQIHITGDSVVVRGLTIDGTRPAQVTKRLYGFDVSGSYADISDNTFIDTTNPAINVVNPQGSHPLNETIERNRITNGSYYAGIHCECDYSFVQHNVIDPLDENVAISIYGQYATVVDNTTAGGAINVYSDNGLIDSNNVDGYVGEDSAVIASGNPVIVSNNLVKNSSLALTVYSHTDDLINTNATVIKNTFESNVAGILMYRYLTSTTTALIGGSAADANTFLTPGAGQLLRLDSVATPINAEFNNWGLCTLSEIEDRITHKPDNAALGLVDYDPFIPGDDCPTPTPSPSPTTSPTSSASVTPSPTLSPGGHIQGDTNCSGQVTAIDGLPQLFKQAGVPYTPPQDCPNLGNGDPEFGDVTCDGEENAGDTFAILQYTSLLLVHPSPQPGCSRIGDPMP